MTTFESDGLRNRVLLSIINALDDSGTGGAKLATLRSMLRDGAEAAVWPAEPTAEECALMHDEVVAIVRTLKARAWDQTAEKVARWAESCLPPLQPLPASGPEAANPATVGDTETPVDEQPTPTVGGDTGPTGGEDASPDSGTDEHNPPETGGEGRPTPDEEPAANPDEATASPAPKAHGRKSK